MELILVPVIAAGLACGVVGALLGTLRGHFLGGLLLGAVLGPLGWLIILVSDDSRRRPCSACAEQVLKVASICPHCRTPVSGG
jgi:hypothetical protein